MPSVAMPSPSVHNTHIGQATSLLHDLQASIDANNQNMREDAYLVVCGIAMRLHAQLQEAQLEVKEAHEARKAPVCRILPSPRVVYEIPADAPDPMPSSGRRRTRDVYEDDDWDEAPPRSRHRFG